MLVLLLHYCSAVRTSSLLGYAGLAMSDAWQAWGRMQTMLTQCIDQVKTSAGTLTNSLFPASYVGVCVCPQP